MAINSYDPLCKKNTPKSAYSSSSSKGSVLMPCHVMKINFAASGSITSETSKLSKRKKRNEFNSPYLANDKTQLLSRIAEKRFLRGNADFTSSFPMAAKLYRTNSAEFKSSKKSGKKVNKKSVLTLPNEPAALPQACTVSDMNDYEYCNQDTEKVRQNKIKKRCSNKNNRKTKALNKGFEYYDRDAQYCSQLNIDLDCSSTDIIRKNNGDFKKKTKIMHNLTKHNDTNEIQPHNVWAVLRNMNAFQFRPSPPMSEDSFVLTPKKKKGLNRRNLENESVVETCTTEHFTYISSIDVDRKSVNTFSPTSSLDRITVIDKDDGLHKTGKKNKTKRVRNQNMTKVNNKGRKKIMIKPQDTKMPRDKSNDIKQANNNQLSPIDTKIKQLKKNEIRTANCNTVDYINNSSDDANRYQALDNFNGYCLCDAENVTGKAIRGNINILCENSGASMYKEGRLASADHSESSKDGKNVSEQDTNTEYDRKSSAKSRVILNKGQEFATKQYNQSLTKYRLVATIPGTIVTPKLTQADIRRRLANIKFPLVILGKDQLSATIEIKNIEPVQFNGLDKHIWPFMVDWFDKPKSPKTNTKFALPNSAKKRVSPIISPNVITTRLPTIDILHNSQNGNNINRYHRRPVVLDTATNKNVDTKPLPVIENKNIDTQKSARLKPIRLLRDRMLKLLYKKSSSRFIADDKNLLCVTDDQCQPSENVRLDTVINEHVDVGTETVTKKAVTVPTSPNNLWTAKRTHTQPYYNKVTPLSQNSKSKRASDFIENVIKKIKSGVYSTHESKKIGTLTSYDCKEVSIQTYDLCEYDRTINRSTQGYTELTPKITIQKRKEILHLLPGFDNELPPLEIKTLNSNVIAVKNCVTNVMLQFDVTVPYESESNAICLKKSCSCIPISVTDSKTKIFKCKPRILNPVLPAELCTIIPKMMKECIEINTKAVPDMISVARDDVIDFHLSTISELSKSDSDDLKVTLPPHLEMSSELRKLANGKFKFNNKEEKRTKVHFIESKTGPFMKLLLKAKNCLEFFSLPHTTPRITMSLKSPKATDILETNEVGSFYGPVAVVPSSKPSSSTSLCCTALQHFTQKGICRLMNYDEARDMSTFKFNFKCSILPFENLGRVNDITVNITIGNNQRINEVLFDVGNSTKNNLRSIFANMFPYKGHSVYSIANEVSENSPAVRPIEYINDGKNRMEIKNSSDAIKLRKKSYVKLFRKCKSTPHITSERTSTSLDRIRNLDEFFLALGTKKFLSSVFDGSNGDKILTSVNEMKNWISEISPRQALLILLLCNKKETSSLVRLRPVILQGIAVNRITRASELDMEIEVIEKESFNKLPKYEGITYISNCVKEYNTLFEELCWIAKTTASDYQKPFGEASEKLLKCLLEKRKKLNPSYLRVMARYVGLGLLKSPKNKI